MKNIFRAVAQTSFVLKSFKVLMLVLLVVFGVTSCENQTEAAQLPESKLDSESILTKTPIEVGTDNSQMEIVANPRVERRELCIGGAGAGQERRGLVIGGSQTAPRSLSQIERQKTSRLLIAIGGNGSGSAMPRNLLVMEIDKQNFKIGSQHATRKLSDIGGSQTAPRTLSEIGGQGCSLQFSEIGGGGNETRKLADIGGQGGVPPRRALELASYVILIGGNYAPRA